MTNMFADFRKIKHMIDMHDQITQTLLCHKQGSGYGPEFH